MLFYLVSFLNVGKDLVWGIKFQLALKFLYFGNEVSDFISLSLLWHERINVASDGSNLSL